MSISYCPGRDFLKEHLYQEFKTVSLAYSSLVFSDDLASEFFRIGEMMTRVLGDVGIGDNCLYGGAAHIYDYGLSTRVKIFAQKNLPANVGSFYITFLSEGKISNVWWKERHYRTPPFTREDSQGKMEIDLAIDDWSKKKPGSRKRHYTPLLHPPIVIGMSLSYFRLNRLCCGFSKELLQELSLYPPMGEVIYDFMNDSKIETLISNSAKKWFKILNYIKI